MFRWVKRPLVSLATILFVAALVIVSIEIADAIGWHSQSGQRTVYALIVLTGFAALIAENEIPALIRRIRHGPPPPPKHREPDWPPGSFKP